MSHFINYFPKEQAAEKIAYMAEYMLCMLEFLGLIFHITWFPEELPPQRKEPLIVSEHHQRWPQTKKRCWVSCFLANDLVWPSVVTVAAQALPVRSSYKPEFVHQGDCESKAACLLISTSFLPPVPHYLDQTVVILNKDCLINKQGCRVDEGGESDTAFVSEVTGVLAQASW